MLVKHTEEAKRIASEAREKLWKLWKNLCAAAQCCAARGAFPMQRAARSKLQTFAAAAARIMGQLRMWLICYGLLQGACASVCSSCEAADGTFLHEILFDIAGTTLYGSRTSSPYHNGSKRRTAMPANRKPLPQRAASAQDQQLEILLRRAAKYQRAHRRSSTPKMTLRPHKRRRAA